MLTSLSIQNVVLIEHLVIEFYAGLCVLTGETGAGKSILLDSLGLALGARSESGLVRKNTDKAQVTAVFNIDNNHIAFSVLENAGILSENEELILRRSVSADGRSKAYINDQPVSVGLLKQVGNMLIEIHGQFETHGLLNPATHKQMLDEYAGIDSKTGDLWNKWKSEEDALEILKDTVDKARTDEEYLRQSLEDIDLLLPEIGEEEKLASMRASLMNRDQILEALNFAYHELSGDDDPVRKAWGIIDRISDKLGEQAVEITSCLQRASSEIEEASDLIQSVSTNLQDNEYNLETIDDRLFALRAQARKHECSVDELSKTREILAEKLNMIENIDEVLAQKIREVEKARGAYLEEAMRIRNIRKETAAKLDELVGKELPPLKLAKARFVTSVESLNETQWSAGGIDRVRFLVATNSGDDLGSLSKIVSGGEMSRFMLALKVVMSEVGSAGSLVFDEVDAGIGGSTADAVGERLACLADSGKQTLVVTHAPQVAARARNHYIVRKAGDLNIKTDIVHLKSTKERREEIARMLAGATVTQEARAAAGKLLETVT
ncbi:MAG: DNA repair protein RecN [Alphaproteobacteria bacterium]|nr:DNA repair protein RecN [Alphaproteobacteria bacterium]